MNYWHHNFGRVTIMWAVVMAAIGLGWRAASPVRHRYPASLDLAWLPALGLVLQWILLPIMVRQYSAFSLEDLSSALADQGEAYRLASQALADQAAERRPLTVVLAIANVGMLTSLPHYAWVWISTGRRALQLLLAIAPTAILALASGRDSAIGPMIVVLLSSLLVAASQRSDFRIRGSWLLAGAVGGFAWLFAWRRVSRANIGGVVYGYCPPGTDCGETVLPTGIGSGLRGILSYMSQGFEGLGHALDATWVFGGGFAHSAALGRLMSARAPGVVHSQLDSLGWSSTAWWSTGLSWFANDLPWALVPLAIALLGVLLRRVWLDAKTNSDPVSLTVLAYTLYVLLYMPQNFTIGLNGPVYVGYLGLTLFWLLRSLPLRGEVGFRTGRVRRRRPAAPNPA